MSSGSAEKTASTTTRRKSRPSLVRTLRRSQRGDRLGVEPLGLLRLPRGLERDRLREPVEPELRDAEVGEHVRRQPVGLAVGGRRGAVALELGAAAMEEVVAAVIGRVVADAELGRERVEAILGRPDPLAADLDDRAVLERWLSVRPPTRSCASRTTTERPARLSSRAAVSPASPAPTIATSASTAAILSYSPLTSFRPRRSRPGRAQDRASTCRRRNEDEPELPPSLNWTQYRLFGSRRIDRIPANPATFAPSTRSAAG